MRAVLDTNIFVSGIHWSGASEKVLRAWFTNKFNLISSMQIIEELVRILISFKKPMQLEDIRWWESAIIEKSILVKPTKKLKVVKNDPDDDKIIEAAVEGKADYIITNDKKHLLSIKQFGSIKIITPEEFIKILKT